MKAYDQIPDWARPEFLDKYGNVACKVCGKEQAPSFRACIYCCKHDELELTEVWGGTDDCGGYEFDVFCQTCGKDFGFDRNELIRNYKVVRK